jgi:hypothetical protein
MSYQVFYDLDVAERLRQKQANHEREVAELSAGKVSPAELERRNNFHKEFPELTIVAIGGRPLR